MNNGYQVAKEKLASLNKKIGDEKRSSYELSPKTCETCGTRIPYEKRWTNRFCGRSCSASTNNQKRNNKIDCVVCGKKNTRNQYANDLYCSGKCKNQHAYDQYIDRWLKGLEDGICGEGFSGHHYIRRYLFETKDAKCELCEWNKLNPTTGKCPLAVDHIDGNWKNNRPTNLRLLCPCCHSITPNYGSLNRGRGRPKRILASSV